MVRFYQEDYRDFLWAKKSDRDGIFTWLPLKNHLNDTQEVAKLLWEHWLSNNQKNIIINSLDVKNEEIAKNLVGFLGAIHDLGKATPAFQGGRSYYQSQDLDRAILEKLEGQGISLRNTRLISDSKSPHGLAGQALAENMGMGKDIASIIGAHHGISPDKKKEVEVQLKSYKSNYFQEENSNGILYKIWSDIQGDILKWALQENDFNNINQLPKVSQIGQVLLSGLLIMSDWIASNESYFPLIDIDEDGIWDSVERIRIGWEKWHKKTPGEVDSQIWNINDTYFNRFGFEKPRDVQLKVAQLIDKSIDPGIVVLEAPMGIGKTEAALYAVEQLTRKNGLQGMFFGLPTQATSNGIFPRIKDWVEKLDKGENKSIQLVHGKAALNEKYSNLLRRVNMDSSDKVVVNQWFSGKKTAVLDNFVVGTVDQLLMMSLKQRHLMLRHLGFSKKTIVIDEVHAYDAYMSQYLKIGLNWLGAYRVSVIILSATLPLAIRNELINSYMAGRYGKDFIEEKSGVSEEIFDYPLISFSDGDQINYFSDFEKDKDKKIKIYDLLEEEIEQLIVKELGGEGIIGIIVNTVGKAQSIAKRLGEIFGEENMILLHSNFIATDRNKKEEELLSMIGKDSQRPSFRIIVGTQVIEQSLDIDFDLLVSELAPMDLLIQRIGRLHRHSSAYRPPNLKEPKVFVFGKNEKYQFDGGSVAVYGKYLLIRTQEIMPSFLMIPNDISKLVQGVYSENTSIEISESLRDEYERARKDHNNLLEEKRNRAKTYLLRSPSSRDNATLVGWLSNMNHQESEERGYAQVRDTQETVEVIALKKIDDGYGIFDSRRRIDTELGNIDTQRKLAVNTLRLPLQLTKSYNIDSTIGFLENYNIKNLADWQLTTWLKGSLGIIFNENNEFEINGFVLKYDNNLGLSLRKEGSDG